MLLAEELLLLALDDERGKVGLAGIDTGLAGAMLIELALLERVRVAERGERVKAGRLVLRPGPPPPHPMLAAALTRLSEREGRKPEQVLSALSPGLRDGLADGLVGQGVLRRERHRVLGLFPTERLPAHNAAPETEVRQRVWAALTGAAPDPRTAALIALLSALDATTKVFLTTDRRAIRRRAKEIAEGQWAAVAVRRAIASINAAASAAVIAAAAASSS